MDDGSFMKKGGKHLKGGERFLIPQKIPQCQAIMRSIDVVKAIPIGKGVNHLCRRLHS